MKIILMSLLLILTLVSAILCSAVEVEVPGKYGLCLNQTEDSSLWGELLCTDIRHMESICFRYIFAMTRYCCRACEVAAGAIGWKPTFYDGHEPGNPKSDLPHTSTKDATATPTTITTAPPTTPPTTPPATTTSAPTNTATLSTSIPTTISDVPQWNNKTNSATANSPTQIASTSTQTPESCSCDDTTEKYDTNLCEFIQATECLELNTTTQCCINCSVQLLRSNRCTASCGIHPGDINGGTLKSQTYKVNQTAVFTCSATYTLKQSDQPMTCHYQPGRGGVWAGHLPTCQLKPSIIGVAVSVTFILVVLLAIIFWRARKIYRNKFQHGYASIEDQDTTQLPISASQNTINTTYEQVDAPTVTENFNSPDQGVSETSRGAYVTDVEDDALPKEPCATKVQEHDVPEINAYVTDVEGGSSPKEPCAAKVQEHDVPKTNAYATDVEEGSSPKEPCAAKVQEHDVPKTNAYATDVEEGASPKEPCATKVQEYDVPKINARVVDVQSQVAGKLSQSVSGVVSDGLPSVRDDLEMITPIRMMDADSEASIIVE